jgi:immune inhibitor A
MKKLIWIIVAVLSLFSPLGAAPPHPQLIERLKAEGKWEEFKTRHERLMNFQQANPQPYRFHLPAQISAAVVPDTVRVVVIYAAPSDRPTSSDGLNVSRAQLQAILFGANPTGSFTDYYEEISYGQTVVIGEVYGPYTLPQTNATYTFGNYGLPAIQFVEDAVAAADPFVDFSQYDNDGDGDVEGLFVVHSGPGGHETGNVNDIWAHASSISEVRDGKVLSRYAIQPEQQTFPTEPVQIGIFCHESGHSLFGLPDLYDYDPPGEGVGEWCVMGSGNYRNGSRTPVHMSAWCKKEVGWLTPVNLTANQNGVSFPTVQFNPTVYRLWTNGSVGLQYFLVENRSKRGFDSFLHGDGGFLIWHIDEAVGGNTNGNRYRVALEQADGLNQLNFTSNRGDAADPYPGTTENRNFDEFSSPNSKSNPISPSGAATQVAVFDISNVDSIMTASLEITYGRPRVSAFGASVNDAAGNGNGLPEPGETVNFFFSFTNAWTATSNWNVKLRSKDTVLTSGDSTALIANLPGLGATTSTSPDPITFTIPLNFGHSRIDSFFLEAWNFDSSYTFSASFQQQIGQAQILLADDDHGRAIENFYKTSFDTLLLPTRSWNVKTQGIPPAESLAAYPYLIWFTGNDSVSLLDAARIAALSNYMNAGGKLVLSGQGIAQTLAGGADSTFLRDYFHCRYVSSQSVSVFAVGVPGHPISDGLQTYLITDGAGNQTQVDRLDFVDGRADKVFTYSNSPGVTTGPTGAIAYADSSHRALFAGFGLEAMGSAPPIPGFASRTQFLGKILDWLDSSAPSGLAVPFISVDAPTLSFSATYQGTLPTPKVVNIENSGAGTLSWTASEIPAAGWLSIAPTGGTAPSVLTISIDSSNLLPGSYRDTVGITSAGAYNTPVKILVTFTVNPFRGDLSADGLFTSSDVVLLLNCVFLDLGNCLPSVADINCDGLLTSADVVILLNEVFLGTTPPC